MEARSGLQEVVSSTAAAAYAPQSQMRDVSLHFCLMEVVRMKTDISTGSGITRPIIAYPDGRLLPENLL